MGSLYVLTADMTKFQVTLVGMTPVYKGSNPTAPIVYEKVSKIGIYLAHREYRESDIVLSLSLIHI